MKKFIALTAGALLALPAIASAQITGECSGCHTMHNSEQGNPVAKVGMMSYSEDPNNPGTQISTWDATGNPVQNLLKFDCVGCHAADPQGPNEITLAETKVPQVLHGGTTDLAGGNFAHGLADTGAEANRNVHNVKDILWGYDIDQVGASALNGPPGLTRFDGTHASKFATEKPFDQFTCAGARGCHGTRSQLLTGHTNANPDADAYRDETTGEWVDGPNVDGAYEGVMRTGIAAVTGAHHLNTNGAKTSTGYTAPTVHDGAVVAAGYRFIPGLMGFENGYINTDASHNEYYGVEAGLGTSCGACHIEQTLHGTPGDYADGSADDANWGLGSRMGLDSTLAVPNNSMSGFCSTCHGNFHSAGGAGDEASAEWTDTQVLNMGDDPSTTDKVEEYYYTDGTDGIMDTATATHVDTDYTDNGVSGAFLRHPSDYTIPDRGDYALYTSYDVTAPVARTTVLTATDPVVRPGQDLVMCLSCHLPHGSQYDYLLRFDYSADKGTMEAGKSADLNVSIGKGGCLACHSAKGVTAQTLKDSGWM